MILHERPTLCPGHTDPVRGHPSPGSTCEGISESLHLCHLPAVGLLCPHPTSRQTRFRRQRKGKCSTQGCSELRLPRQASEPAATRHTPPTQASDPHLPVAGDQGRGRVPSLRNDRLNRPGPPVLLPPQPLQTYRNTFALTRMGPAPLSSPRKGTPSC